MSRVRSGDRLHDASGIGCGAVRTGVGLGLWARVGLGLGLGIGHVWLWASGGSCGACMCWCMCCMRATCEISCVQGAVMSARFNVRGLKVSLEAGVLCSAVTCGAWGAFVRREPGQGDVAGGGALGSWCMRGWAKQALSQGSVSTEEQPNPSRNLPATRHFRSASLPLFTPSSSLDFRGLRWQGRFNQGLMADYHLVSPRTNFPFTSPRRGYGSVPRVRQSLITRSGNKSE